MAKIATGAGIGCLVALGIGLSPVAVPLWGMSVLGYCGFTTTVTLFQAGIVGAGFVAASTGVGAAAGSAFEEWGDGGGGEKREREDKEKKRADDALHAAQTNVQVAAVAEDNTGEVSPAESMQDREADDALAGETGQPEAILQNQRESDF